MVYGDMNNMTEQDHGAVGRSRGAVQCFGSFHFAERTLTGVEAVHMMRKGQVKRLSGDDVAGRAKFIESLFGIAA